MVLKLELVYTGNFNYIWLGNEIKQEQKALQDGETFQHLLNARKISAKVLHWFSFSQRLFPLLSFFLFTI